MKRIIVATNNQYKVKEIKEILGDIELVSLADAGIDIDVEENGLTFEENALIKARAIYNLTHEPVISDDSGLSVFALNGRPGVLSARFAGVHGDTAANNRKLLDELKGVTDRRAEFVCAVAFISDKGEIVKVGRSEGEILLAPDGEGGFGYDPLFYSYDLHKSFAAATPQEKNSVSHRARALLSLKPFINL